MNIVADEHLTRDVLDRLRQDGHHIQRIAQIARGSDDSVVLDIANRPDILLLTEDKDFGDLVFHQHLQASGVLLIRLPGLLPREKAEIIAQVLQEQGSKLLNRFTVLTKRGIRTRELDNLN